MKITIDITPQELAEFLSATSRAGDKQSQSLNLDFFPKKTTAEFMPNGKIVVKNSDNGETVPTFFTKG